MKVNISNPETETLFFAITFLILLIFSIRKNIKRDFFSVELTNELKGIGILAIIFSHIGYIVSQTDKFLFPFSAIAGVGVNLFLFLSGFGLTMSALKKPISILDFYKKRLFRLFIPLWITLTFFLIVDFLNLSRIYPLASIIQNYLGVFKSLDVYTSLDSPLWYFNLIFFYYLLFPVLSWKKLIYLSPIFTFLAGNLAIKYAPDFFDKDMITIFKLHTLAFPFGIMFGILNTKLLLKMNVNKTISNIPAIVNIILIIIFLGLFLFNSYYSHVGEGIKIEQNTSLITMFLLTGFFILKKVEFRIFDIFGKYSYEIYLLHLPLMLRHDLFFKILPPFIAVFAYLILFLISGFTLQKISKLFVRA